MSRIFKSEWVGDEKVESFKALLADIESQEVSAIPYTARWRNIQKAKWQLRDTYYGTPAFDYARWRLTSML